MDGVFCYIYTMEFEEYIEQVAAELEKLGYPRGTGLLDRDKAFALYQLGIGPDKAADTLAKI